ncbi:MAG: prenyltransferase [Caldilineaceae bacterium]
MEITEHNFSSTQRLQQHAQQRNALTEAEPTAQTQWLQGRLYQPPGRRWYMTMRLLRPRFSLALFAAVICGAWLGWWHSGNLNGLTTVLLLLGSGMTVLGLNLLHEYHDYRYALKSNDVQFHRVVFATGYHLLAADQVQARHVCRLGYGLIGLGFLCYLGLVSLLGWPLMFFYVVSLLLAYTYSAPPIRYGYRGWGLGECGLFVSYGLLPFLGSYYIVSQTLTTTALFVTAPFGIGAILLFANYNFMHQHRDWLMRKRTMIVAVGPARARDINAMLTLLIYILFLCIVSLAYLPLIVLITLAALPLAMRIYGQLRADDIALEESFLLYRATVTSLLWTSALFCLALVIDQLF